MKITIKRSDNWCREQAILDGVNRPEFWIVEISPTELTKEARRAILSLKQLPGPGEYPPVLESIGYRSDGELTVGYSGWGRCRIELDADTPSPDDISLAIVDAVYEAGAIRRQLEVKRERERKIEALESEIQALRAQA